MELKGPERFARVPPKPAAPASTTDAVSYRDSSVQVKSTGSELRRSAARRLLLKVSLRAGGTVALFVTPGAIPPRPPG